MSNRARPLTNKRARPSKTNIQNKRKKANRKPAENNYLPPSPAKQVVSLIWNLFFYLVVAMVLIGVVFFSFNDSPDKSFYGYRFMTVKTNSMAPNSKKSDLKDGFLAGDLIILKKTDPTTLKKKDIITFYPIAGNTKAFLTHRIVATDTPVVNEQGEEANGFTTQGDANDGADVPIPKSSVVGKVIGHISGIGLGMAFVKENIVLVSLVIVSFIGFSLTLKYYLQIPKIVKPIPKRRKKPMTKKKVITKTIV